MYAPSDPRLVAGFRREGTDVAIRLDLPQMFADKVTIFKSKADVLLLPNVVGPQYILTIHVLAPRRDIISAPHGTTLQGASSNDKLRRPPSPSGLAYWPSVLS